MLNILGFIVGVLGLAYGVYSHQSMRVVRRLQLQHRTTAVFASVPPGVESPKLNFGDRGVHDAAYITSIQIRNTGNSTVRKSEFRAPLRVRLNGGTPTDFIDGGVYIPAGKKGFDVDVKEVDDGFDLEWDYFDPKIELSLFAYTKLPIHRVDFDGSFDLPVALRKSDSDKAENIVLAGAFVVFGLLALVEFFPGVNKMLLSWGLPGVSPEYSRAAIGMIVVIPVIVAVRLGVGMLSRRIMRRRLDEAKSTQQPVDQPPPAIKS